MVMGKQYEIDDVLDLRPQEQVIQIEQEGRENVPEHVIQIEQERGEHKPECKLCFSTNTSNFINGSMAYMCRVDDGWPLCRDCGGRFRLNRYGNVVPRF